MKVIIADDEEKICQLIMALIDWIKYDMQVVAIVHNGIEAIEAIKVYKPDIVITDIRMPGLDGLEMVKEAKKIKNDIEFVVISGYKYFEYAQNSLRYGVREYLLKPIKKIELEDALERIKENYLEKNNKLSIEEKNRITIQNSVAKIRNTFLNELLQGYLWEENSIKIQSVNTEYHFNFKEGLFQIFLIKIDGIDTSLSMNNTYIREKVKYVLSKYQEEFCFEAESLFENNLCYGIINYCEENRRIIRKLFKNLLDELVLQKNILNNIDVTIGLGTVVSDLVEIKKSLKTARWNIEQRIVSGTNKVIDGEIRSSDNMVQSELFYKFNKSMIEALESLDEELVEQSIFFLKEQLSKGNETTGHEIFQMAKQAMNLYLLTMQQMKLGVRDSETIFDQFSIDIENVASINEIIQLLLKYLVKSFREAIYDKKEEDSKPIREAKRYIREHYMEPISLEIVSDVIGFNPTYFSTMFKKESKVSFSEYLMSIRMDKAKELLKETNSNVSKICEMVGYNDTKHFTKCFIKYTNLKPNEYRKIYS